MARNFCQRLSLLSSATRHNIGVTVPTILYRKYDVTAKPPLCYTKECSEEQHYSGCFKIAAPSKARPVVCVGVFITNRHHPGCVVVGLRKGSSGAGLYGLPGGHLEFGESWEECGRREVLEETGLTLREVKYCTVVNSVGEAEKYHFVTLFVQGEVDTSVKSEPENLEPEKCLGWEWTNWNDLPPLDKLFCPLQKLRQQGYNPFRDEQAKSSRERHDDDL